MNIQFSYYFGGKEHGRIVSGDTVIEFRKFTDNVVDPVETRIDYIRYLLANPKCDIRSGSEKFMGWEFRFKSVKKYLVRSEYGISLMYGFSVKQLRETAYLSRKTKVILAPANW